MQQATLAYNNAWHRAIGCTPNECAGRNDQACLIEGQSKKEWDQVVEEARRITVKYREEYENLEKPTEKMSVGEKVWYADPTKTKKKLSPMWDYKGVVVDRATNSCKILLEDNREIIANQRLIKRRIIPFF